MARPSKYNAKFHPKLVKALASKGLTDKEMAKELEITEQTLNNWKKDHKEFFEALKKGKDSKDDQVENTLLRKALGYIDEDNVELFHFQGKVIEHKIPKRYQPDTTSIIFWLKNRRPEKWRDRKDIDLTCNSFAEWVKKVDESKTS